MRCMAPCTSAGMMIGHRPSGGRCENWSSTTSLVLHLDAQLEPMGPEIAILELKPRTRASPRRIGQEVAVDHAVDLLVGAGHVRPVQHAVAGEHAGPASYLIPGPHA